MRLISLDLEKISLTFYIHRKILIKNIHPQFMVLTILNCFSFLWLQSFSEERTKNIHTKKYDIFVIRKCHAFGTKLNQRICEIILFLFSLQRSEFEDFINKD